MGVQDTLSVSGMSLLRGVDGHDGFDGLDGLDGLDEGCGGGSSVGGGKASACWDTSCSGDGFDGYGFDGYGFDGYGFVGVAVGNIDEVQIEVEGMDPETEDTEDNPLDMGEGVVDMDVGEDGVDVCDVDADVVVVVGVPVPVSVGEVVAAGRFPCAECGNRSCGAEVPSKGRMSREKYNVCEGE